MLTTAVISILVVEIACCVKEKYMKKLKKLSFPHFLRLIRYKQFTKHVYL